VALFFCTAPDNIGGRDNNDVAKSTQKVLLFTRYFISSFIAVLLAPLILKTIGNDILVEFTKPYYEYILIIGYITLIALGGVPLIKKTIATHFSAEIAKKLSNLDLEVSKLEKAQTELIKSTIEIDAERKADVIKLCTLIDNNKGIIDISSVPEELQLASTVALSKSLIIFSMDNTKYKITQLGKMYTEE
jgi:hypothetical protein